MILPFMWIIIIIIYKHCFLFSCNIWIYIARDYKLYKKHSQENINSCFINQSQNGLELQYSYFSIDCSAGSMSFYLEYILTYICIKSRTQRVVFAIWHIPMLKRLQIFILMIAALKPNYSISIRTKYGPMNGRTSNASTITICILSFSNSLYILLLNR